MLEPVPPRPDGIEEVAERLIGLAVDHAHEIAWAPDAVGPERFAELRLDDRPDDVSRNTPSLASSRITRWSASAFAPDSRCGSSTLRSPPATRSVIPSSAITRDACDRINPNPIRKTCCDGELIPFSLAKPLAFCAARSPPAVAQAKRGYPAASGCRSSSMTFIVTIVRRHARVLQSRARLSPQDDDGLPQSHPRQQPGMSDLMNTVTPEQIAALASYLAGL